MGGGCGWYGEFGGGEPRLEDGLEVVDGFLLEDVAGEEEEGCEDEDWTRWVSCAAHLIGYLFRSISCARGSKYVPIAEEMAIET